VKNILISKQICTFA